MEDLQHRPRVGDDSATDQSEETHGQESSAVSVARLLANPRRVRRN